MADRRIKDRRADTGEQSTNASPPPSLFRALKLKRENRKRDRRTHEDDRRLVHIDQDNWRSLVKTPDPDDEIKPSALLTKFPDLADKLQAIVKDEVSRALHDRTQQSVPEGPPPTAKDRYAAAILLMKEWKKAFADILAIRERTNEQKNEALYAAAKADMVEKLFLPAIIEQLTPDERKELEIEEVKLPFNSQTMPSGAERTAAELPKAPESKKKKRSLGDKAIWGFAGVTTLTLTAALTIPSFRDWAFRKLNVNTNALQFDATHTKEIAEWQKRMDEAKRTGRPVVLPGEKGSPEYEPQNVNLGVQTDPAFNSPIALNQSAFKFLDRVGRLFLPPEHKNHTTTDQVAKNTDIYASDGNPNLEFMAKAFQLYKETPTDPYALDLEAAAKIISVSLYKDGKINPKAPIFFVAVGTLTPESQERIAKLDQAERGDLNAQPKFGKRIVTFLEEEIQQYLQDGKVTGKRDNDPEAIEKTAILHAIKIDTLRHMDGKLMPLVGYGGYMGLGLATSMHGVTADDFTLGMLPREGPPLPPPPMRKLKEATVNETPIHEQGVSKWPVSKIQQTVHEAENKRAQKKDSERLSASAGGQVR